MRNFLLIFFCLLFHFIAAQKQPPGKIGMTTELKVDDPIIQDLIKKNEGIQPPRAVRHPIKTKSSMAGKKVTQGYIILLTSEVVQPFAKENASRTNRESRAQAAKKHEAVAKEKVTDFALENLDINPKEIGSVFFGLQVGLSVELDRSRSASSWLAKAKSVKGVKDIFEDVWVEASSFGTPKVVDQHDKRPLSTQYHGYHNWVAGGCNCTNYSKWVWVLDTGIDDNHPDLNVKRSYGYSYVRTESFVDDRNGHGTHVAGIIAAKNNGFGAKGIGHGAWVVPVKVMDKRGFGSMGSVLAGVNRIFSYGIPGDVVVLSASAPTGTFFAQSAVETALKNLSRRGIYVVLPAGNNSNRASRYTPGRANENDIYTIATTQELPQWTFNRLSNTTNTGTPPVDFAAPGIAIYSTYKNGWYAFQSGSCMAAATFAGTILCGTKRNRGYYFSHVTPLSHKLKVIRAK